jgi:hypothetical protein
MFTQAGVKLQQVDTPGEAYGVSHSPSGLVYVMMKIDNGSGLGDGIHSWDGSSWTPVLTGIEPVGNLQAFTEP